MLACVLHTTQAIPEPKCKPLPAGYCDEVPCEWPYNLTKKQCQEQGFDNSQFQYLPHGRHCGCCPECIQVKGDPGF